jgi:hypothetical protein
VESVETFEEAYFEVKRHHEQADEHKAQNAGSIQDLGSESAYGPHNFKSLTNNGASVSLTSH